MTEQEDIARLMMEKLMTTTLRTLEHLRVNIGPNVTPDRIMPGVALWIDWMAPTTAEPDRLGGHRSVFLPHEYFGPTREDEVRLHIKRALEEVIDHIVDHA